MALSLKEISQKISQNPKLVIVEDYEIGVEERVLNTTTYLSNKKKSEKREKRYRITLRLLHRKREGESYTTSTDRDSLNSLVESAIETAENTLPCPWFRFPIWRASTKEKAEQTLLDLNGEDFTPPEGVTVLGKREEVKTRLQRKTEKLVLEQEYANTAVEAFVSVSVGQKEELLSERLKNPKSTNEIYALAKKLLNQKKYFSGAVAHALSPSSHLVFSSSVGASILEKASILFMADNHAAEILWNSDSKNFSQKVSIFDDGQKAIERGEFFDLEGVAGQKVVLVQAGKMLSLLHNTTTGAKYNRPGTGSLRVFDSFRGPRISFSHLYMEKGEKSIEEIIHNLSDGVFIESASEWEIEERKGVLFLRFDAFGWKIESGEGKYPVFCEKLSFPLSKFFERVSEVSNAVEWHGSVASPAVAVQNLIDAAQ